MLKEIYSYIVYNYSSSHDFDRLCTRKRGGKSLDSNLNQGICLLAAVLDVVMFPIKYVLPNVSYQTSYQMCPSKHLDVCVLSWFAGIIICPL